MKIAIPKETRSGETRVATSPDMVKKLIQTGAQVVIETGAGDYCKITDAAFTEAGAFVAADAKETYAGAEIVLKVRGPMTNEEGTDELALMDPGSILIGLLSPLQNRASISTYAKFGLTTFSMELLPRISRAQSMDVLSSQSNLAGYKAVIDAAEEFGKAFPMMMTAAGTIAPAKVLILGAGVAGLQAIATAKRLGAVVSAFDVRPAVKEQVESLGAKFIEVTDPGGQDAETTGGYAKEMSEDYKKQQSKLIHDTVKTQDIVITTALIPGRPAPELIPSYMVEDMKGGSIIIDLAVEAGGNCPLSEIDKVVVKHGVTLVGHSNMPARIPVDSSALLARNLVNFLIPMIDTESGNLSINWEDEIISGTLTTRDGEVVHPMLKDKV